MIRASTIAAGVLALSASGAVAQSMTSMSPDLNSTYIVDEYGRHYNERGDQIYARGKAPTSQDRSWRYSAVPSGPSQAVMAPSAGTTYSGSTYIVDEYGRHYNERGDRIR